MILFSSILHRLRSLIFGGEKKAQSLVIKEEKIEQSFSYSYGQFSIQLPIGHMLPTYQQQHKLYDRFLPHLAKYLCSVDMVIDVGANCGDTLAAMFSENSSLRYVCIEPDDEFYEYLEKNVAQIKQSFPNASIQLLQCLISDIDVSAGLSGSGGTKHRDEDAVTGSRFKSRRLAEVLSEVNSGKCLRLIKSDVDGYDYDVLNSAGEWLNSEKLILFFECMYSDAIQRDGYIKLIEKLFARGFSDYWIFDNFGSLILHSVNADTILQLIDYVWRQNQGAASRSIYYFDILAAKPDDVGFISNLVRNYSDS